MILIVLSLLSTPVLKGGELRLYSISSPKIVFTGDKLESISCRIALNNALRIKKIMLYITGPKCDNAGIIKIMGKQGGLPIPIFTDKSTFTKAFDKTKDGYEVVELEIPEKIEKFDNTFFIIIEQLNTKVGIICDKDSSLTQCMYKNINYTNCQIKQKNKQWSLLPYNINISFDVEKLESKENFYIDTLAFKSYESYVGKFKMLACGDYNNDNYIDVLVNGKLFTNISGQFVLNKDTVLSENFDYAIFADLNNNKKQEIVQFKKNGTLGTLFEYGNNRLEKIAEFYHPVINKISSLSIGNYNNDEYPDIIISHYLEKDSNRISNTFVILGSKSVPKIAEYKNNESSNKINSALFVDIESDGKTELFIKEDRKLCIDNINKDIFDIEANNILGEYKTGNDISPTWIYADKDNYIDVFLPRNLMNRFSTKNSNIVLSRNSKFENDNHNLFLSKYTTGDYVDLNCDGLEDFVLVHDNDCNATGVYFQNEDGTFSDVTTSEGFPVLKNISEFLVVDARKIGAKDLLFISNDSLKLIRNTYKKFNTFQFDDNCSFLKYNSIIELYEHEKIHKTQFMSTRGNNVILSIPKSINFTENLLDSVKIYENGSKNVFTFYDVKNKDIISTKLTNSNDILDLESDSKVVVFPNPAKDEITLNVYGQCNESKKIFVEDVLGNLIDVIETTDKLIKWKCKNMNGSSLENGYYNIRVEGCNEVLTSFFHVVK